MSDHVPLKRPRTETGEEYIEKVPKANVAPMLTCIGCNGFFRGPVTFCQNKHSLCSNCFGDQKECPFTGCGQKAALTVDVLSELVKELKFPVSCKFKKDGCNQENADEEVIADHEIECGHRKVPCFWNSCHYQPAMNLEAHLFSAHDDYGKGRDNPSKWFFAKFMDTEMLGAQKMWIDLESGLRFRATLRHNDEEKHWRCYTVVFAGKNVAKKFRTKIMLSSHDTDTGVLSYCNVKCLDDWKELDTSKEFGIIDGQFKNYNKGQIVLGDHNKDKNDKNGELTLPITVEVKMKKLNV